MPSIFTRLNVGVMTYRAATSVTPSRATLAGLRDLLNEVRAEDFLHLVEFRGIQDLDPKVLGPFPIRLERLLDLGQVIALVGNGFEESAVEGAVHMGRPA